MTTYFAPQTTDTLCRPEQAQRVERVSTQHSKPKTTFATSSPNKKNLYLSIPISDTRTNPTIYLPKNSPPPHTIDRDRKEEKTLSLHPDFGYIIAKVS